MPGRTSIDTVPATPPTKVSSSTMLGSAIRRRAVKYSASAHDTSATNAPPSPVAMRSPICPTAINRSPIAIVTKMSLNPVSSRNCSSSTAGRGMAGRRRTPGRTVPPRGIAPPRSPLRRYRLRCTSPSPRFRTMLRGVYWRYNTRRRVGDGESDHPAWSARPIIIDCSAPICGTISPVRSAIAAQLRRHAFCGQGRRPSAACPGSA